MPVLRAVLGRAPLATSLRTVLAVYRALSQPWWSQPIPKTLLWKGSADTSWWTAVHLPCLAAQLHRLLSVERLLILIDGVANRADVDHVLADIADLVVVPYGPSAQDGARAVANLEGLPTAVAMPNRWPTHPGVARRARRWLDAVPAERRLPPLRAIPRLDALLGPDAYGEIAYEIASPARGLILEILARAGMWPEELVAVR